MRSVHVEIRPDPSLVEPNDRVCFFLFNSPQLARGKVLFGIVLRFDRVQAELSSRQFSFGGGRFVRVRVLQKHFADRRGFDVVVVGCARNDHRLQLSVFVTLFPHFVHQCVMIRVRGQIVFGQHVE